MESEYDGERRAEILSTAEEQAGKGTNGIMCKQDADAVNEQIKQIDATFYNNFVVSREITMAQKASWLQTHDHESILVVLGEAHIYNVRDYVADIQNRNQVTPVKPTVYSPTDLDEFVLPDSIIEEQIATNMNPAPPRPLIKERLIEAKASYKQLVRKYRTG